MSPPEGQCCRVTLSVDGHGGYSCPPISVSHIKRKLAIRSDRPTKSDRPTISKKRDRRKKQVSVPSYETLDWPDGRPYTLPAQFRLVLTLDHIITREFSDNDAVGQVLDGVELYVLECSHA